MTLIAVSRTKNIVSFSSDSRISFGSDGYFDKGIKLFSVPFKLSGPAKTREDFYKNEFEHEYGLAVVGSSVNAYTVKDSIVELLPNIKYLTNLSDVSIPSLGNIIFKVYKEISEELLGVLRQNGLCEIIFGGYCLHAKKIRILRFYPTVTPEKVEFSFEEILKDDGMLFFGSGSKKAEEIFDSNKSLEPLHVIKKVILSKEIPSVGGSLQIGTFYSKDFKITGVLENEVDTNGEVIKSVRYRRGFKVENDITDALKPPYIFIKYSYKSVNVESID